MLPREGANHTHKVNETLGLDGQRQLSVGCPAFLVKPLHSLGGDFGRFDAGFRGDCEPDLRQCRARRGFPGGY